jgi:Tol biopolymer transport system component
MPRKLKNLTTLLMATGPVLAALSCMKEDVTSPTTEADLASVTAAAQSRKSSTSKIAFLTGRDNPEFLNELYVMNPDGGGVQRLTVGHYIESFDWSPDGRRIVFQSFPANEIYAINVDGTGLVNLTNTPAIREQLPDWSPDGRRIAFHRDGGIYLMNSDGSNVRALVSGASFWDWSPDGRKIAFLGHDHLGRERDYYVISVDGGGETKLTNTPQDHKQSPPAWSPDGRRVAFEAIPGPESFFEIYVVNSDGSALMRLTHTAENDDTPYWSPDGRRIAFLTDRDRGQLHDSREIYVMRPDGRKQTNLTNTPGGTDPSGNSEFLRGWSPDGRKILYVRNGEIWVMNANGKGQTNLNQDGTDPAWSPK